MTFHRCCLERPLCVIVGLIATACAALLFSCSDYESPADVDDVVRSNDVYSERTASATSAKEWTFLLYAAADAGPTYSPLMSFAEHFPSGDCVNALCLEDRSGETAKLWHIDANHQAVVLEDIGEVNMGSATTLSNFLDYAKTNYPAERYIISFYGHGGGWGGACNDIDPEFGVLRMDDMKEALQNAGGVDLVLFSAPCWMGALESAYELRECTEVYIASEHESFYRFWENVMASISEELNSHPSISDFELAELIIGWMEKDRRNYAPYGGLQYLTMSAIRMDRMEPLRDAIDDLALTYLADPDQLRTFLESVRKKIVCFDNTSITDLNSVLLSLQKVEMDMATRAKLKNVMHRLSDAVISEIHLPKYRNIGGLTIFLPDEETANVLPYYVDDVFGLDFVQDSHWDELLFALFPEAGDVEPTFDDAFPMLWDRLSREKIYDGGIETEQHGN